MRTLKRILLDRSKFQAFQWFQCQGWLEGIHQPFQPFLWWWRKWRYLHWHVAARQICLEIQVQCQAFEGNSARVRAGYLSRSFMRPDPRSQATKYFNLVCLSSCSVSFDSVNSTTDTAIRALLAKDFGCLIRIRTLDNFSSASRSSRVPPFKWNNFRCNSNRRRVDIHDVRWQPHEGVLGSLENYGDGALLLCSGTACDRNSSRSWAEADLHPGHHH